jgi:predicted aspartyl protease
MIKPKCVALVLAASIAAPTTLSGKEQILCRHPGHHDIVITLAAKKQFGRVLNCISGDFIFDLTPCAPDGAYGLSAGTGTAPLVEIAKDYTTHSGGVTSNLTNDREIYFSGGFNSPQSNTTINENRAAIGLPPIAGGDKVPQLGYEENWSFSLSRLTGEAKLKQENSPVTPYICNVNSHEDSAKSDFGPQKESTSAPENLHTTVVPLREQGNTFVVPVSINGSFTIDFILDSGASDVSVPGDVVLTLIRMGTITKGDFLGKENYRLADGSLVPSERFIIRSLKVGDRVLENVTGSVAPVEGSLLLGQSFLSRFKSWSIDNQRQALILN